MDEKDFYKQTTIPGIEAVESPQPIQVPAQIGPYKIDSLLEKGGMSILYLATHPDTHHPIVIKVLEPKFLSRPDIVKRFLDEVKIIGLPDNPHIVKLFSHGEWEGGLYIAMEFIEGISLRQYLLKTPLSLRRALEIVIDIAYALCHLHTHGIIHRDLKPENVLVTKSDEIKVIDFGIAQLLTEQPDPKAPAKQRIIGTPIYMSPEQRANPDNVSYPTDIYSLGIIMYELVLGKLSHGQIHLNLMPLGIKKILQKTLQHDEKKRYQDIVDLITDINEYLDSEEMRNETEHNDKLRELSETMKHIRTSLLPKTPPDWPSLSITAAGKDGSGESIPFYDFYSLPDQQYGIIIGECLNQKTEGLFYTATLRGMIRSFLTLASDPKQFISHLNDQIFEDPLKQLFSIHYLLIDEKKNTLESISCGHSPLWIVNEEKKQKISIENPPLGKKLENPLQIVSIPLKDQDLLVLSSSELPEEIQIEENAETMIKKIKHSLSRSFTIVLIKKITLE